MQTLVKFVNLATITANNAQGLTSISVPNVSFLTIIAWVQQAATNPVQMVIMEEIPTGLASVSFFPKIILFI